MIMKKQKLSEIFSFINDRFTAQLQRLINEVA